MKFTLSPFFQALTAVLIIVGGAFILFGPGPISQNIGDGGSGFNTTPPDQKIYVAIEGEGKLAVIDSSIFEVITNINLGGFSPHNLQVSPDNKTVWVTGNAVSHTHSFRFKPVANAEEGHDESDEDDQVIVINPLKDSIIKRVKIKPGIHLAHVVITPDSMYAYVTAQVSGSVYKIDAESFEVVKEIKTGEQSQPHGIRIAPDGRYAYVAMLGSKALGIIRISDDYFYEIPLGGAAVQTGTTPDGKYIVVSLYDTKRLAVYNVNSEKIEYIDLPDGARGPIQMYSTPDSKFIYLADQGYYFNQPSGELVYKIDIENKKIVKEIKAGQAPHGVVVSGDGKLVYVTNLLSDDISVIDAFKDKEIKKIKVGQEPNGISIWDRN